MKLSQVQEASKLVAQRRQLVRSYVEVGTAKELGACFGYFGAREWAFGFEVDDPMREALRVAARKEIRRRIDQADKALGDLGVEVDGLAIAIRSEEDRIAEEKAKREADKITIVAPPGTKVA